MLHISKLLILTPFFYQQVTRGHDIVADGWAGAYNPQSHPNHTLSRAVGNWVKFHRSIYSCLTHIYAKKEGFPTSGGLCEDRKPCRQNLAHHFHEEKKMFLFPAIFGMSLAIISTYCQSCSKTR